MEKQIKLTQILGDTLHFKLTKTYAEILMRAGIISDEEEGAFYYERYMDESAMLTEKLKCLMVTAFAAAVSREQEDIQIEIEWPDLVKVHYPGISSYSLREIKQIITPRIESMITFVMYSIAHYDVDMIKSLRRNDAETTVC